MVKTRKACDGQSGRKRKRGEHGSDDLDNGKQTNEIEQIQPSTSGSGNEKMAKKVSKTKGRRVKPQAENNSAQNNSIADAVEATFEEGGKVAKFNMQNVHSSEGEVSEEESENEAQDSDSEDDEVILSQNNNATRKLDNSHTEEEELDYYDDVQTDESQAAAATTDEDEENSQEDLEILREIKADRKRKRKAELKKKKTLALVGEYCADNDYIIVRKTEKARTPVRSKSPTRRSGKFFGRGQGNCINNLNQSPSEATIYKWAVERVWANDSREDVISFWNNNNQLSSSSDGGAINTSDEIDDETINGQLTQRFIAECQIDADQRKYKLPPPLKDQPSKQ